HALLREGQEPAAASALAGRLAEQPGEVVVRLQDRFKAGQPDPLLTIDAFEEVFTLAPPGEASRFGACLAAAALTGRCRVVLTLRDDFLGRLASIEILRSWLGATYVLAPLGKASLELAISEPLRRAGYQAETPALVSRIASDVGDRPGGLPLVQFACAALWERRDRERRVILSSVYDELGGATGALATHAQAFLSQLPASDVRVAREVLLRLVTADGTRRPRLRPDLVSGLPAGAEAMVDRLTAQRLLVVTREPGTDEAYVELAHESLARTWPVLARWIEESTEERSLLQQMEEAARLWDRHGRDAYGTWSEDRAAQIQARVTERGLVLSETALAFLGASLARARRERRVRRLVLGGIIGALGLTTAASAFAAYTFRQRQLVSGDIGRFDLVLQPHDFDPATRRWSPHAGGGPLSWTLAPSTGKHCCDASPPYGDEDLTRGAPAEGADGAWTTRVEAPSRAAVLTVNRSACPPSRIRLDRLPGLGERDHPRSIRIPVPTCEASRAQAIPVPGGPYWAPVDDEGENAAPATRAVLVDVPGFSMDEVEVTNGRYALFEKVFPLTGEQARTRPPTDNPAFTHALEPGYPVIGINFHGAEAFCAWAGMALPVLDEWRKAARGGQYLDGTAKAPNPAERRRTVWAGEAVPGTVVIGRPDLGPAPAGSSGDDRSPYGIKDLAGSLTEWVAPDSRHPLPDGFAFTAGADWAARVDDLRHEIGWAGYRKKTYDDFNSGLRCVER
ncbi:MAG TPA: SUMF1/EgtB/PvdO family nonheme iron enzyme, partial [Myxococcaceae bacterium]